MPREDRLPVAADARNVFLAYSQQVLVSTLEPDDIVMMDDLASHKVAGARAAIEARGATLL